MGDKIDIDQQSLMELDIDQRLTWLWERIDQEPERLGNLDFVAGLIRAAYGQGYVDALKEPRGLLHSDHGYTIPQPFDSKTK